MVKLGIHVTKASKVLDDKKPAKSLVKAIERECDILPINAVQIFTYGPRNTKKNTLKYDQIMEYKDDNKIDLSVHSCYASVSIWKVPTEHYKAKDKLVSEYPTDTPKQKAFDQTYRASIKLIEDQIKSCTKIGAWGLVLHITKHPPETVAKVMKFLKFYAVKYDVKIILEMVSSKADGNTYETPEKINNLTEMIESDSVNDDNNDDETNTADWWCWCVDTAHLHGAGIDIKSKDSMKKWLAGIKHKQLIGMFHLNGSSAVLGSGKDKHEIAFSKDDLIWKDVDVKKSGLYKVVKFCKKYECTIICEINRGKEKDSKDLLDIINDI